MPTIELPILNEVSVYETAPVGFITDDKVKHLISHYDIYYSEKIDEEKALSLLQQLWHTFSLYMQDSFKQLDFDNQRTIDYMNIMRCYVTKDQYFLYLKAYSETIHSKSGLSLYASPGDSENERPELLSVMNGFNGFISNDNWLEGKDKQFIGLYNSENRKAITRMYSLNNPRVFFFIRGKKHSKKNKKNQE